MTKLVQPHILENDAERSARKRLGDLSIRWCCREEQRPGRKIFGGDDVEELEAVHIG